MSFRPRSNGLDFGDGDIRDWQAVFDVCVCVCVYVCVWLGLSLLVSASFAEDSYGVVQSSLPGIITILLDTLEVGLLQLVTLAMSMQTINSTQSRLVCRLS